MTAQRVPAAGLVERAASTRLPTEYGEFTAYGYRTARGVDHLTLVRGDVADGAATLVRLHSECLTGDVLGSLRCDCGPQLGLRWPRSPRPAAACVVYLRGHEGRGIGLVGQARGIRPAGRRTRHGGRQPGTGAACGRPRLRRRRGDPHRPRREQGQVAVQQPGQGGRPFRGRCPRRRTRTSPWFRPVRRTPGISPPNGTGSGTSCRPDRTRPGRGVNAGLRPRSTARIAPVAVVLTYPPRYGYGCTTRVLVQAWGRSHQIGDQSPEIPKAPRSTQCLRRSTPRRKPSSTGSRRRRPRWPPLCRPCGPPRTSPSAGSGRSGGGGRLCIRCICGVFVMLMVMVWGIWRVWWRSCRIWRVWVWTGCG